MAESKTKKNITLGSGFIFSALYTGTIPTHEIIETEENRLGYTVGGASLEYKATAITEKDDFGLISKTLITEEEVVLKCGLLGWDGNNLAKLCSTARIEEDAENGKRTVKIGGIKNDDGKSYIIRFVHPDKDGGAQRITVVGKNQAGFTLEYVADKATSVEPEFKAEPCDDEGTLIIFEEEIPKTPVT